MNLNRPAIDLLNKRLASFEGGSESVLQWVPSESLKSFLGRVFDPKLAPFSLRRYWLLHLAWTVRYPTHQQHTEAKERIEAMPRNAWIEALENEILYSGNWKFNTKDELVIPHTPQDAFWVDLTHTLSFPAVTGIQRVVYQSAANWIKKKRPVSFIRFNSIIETPEVLTEQDIQFVHDQANSVKKNISNSKTNLIDILNTIFERVVIQTLLFLFSRSQFRDKIIFFARKFKSQKTKRLKEWIRKRKVKKISQQALRVPLLLGQRMAITELLLEPERIQFYIDLAEADSTFRLSLVVHDLIPIYYPELFINTSSFIDYLRLLRVADKISTTTQSVKNEVGSYLKLAPQHRAPNIKIQSLATQFSIYPTKREKTERDLKPPTPIIICVGTLEPRKNHIDIIHACLALHLKGINFKVVFIGGMGWNYDSISQAIRLAKDSGLDLEILQGLTDSELQHWYEKCAFTIFYSVAEGFGLPVLESIAAGKVCIASDIPTNRELSEKYGGCILVKPKSPHALSEAIEAQLKRPNDNFVRRNLPIRTWDEYSDELFDFFSDRSFSSEATLT